MECCFVQCMIGSEINQLFSNVKPDMKIDVKEGNLPYLKYHREHVFKK